MAMWLFRKNDGWSPIDDFLANQNVTDCSEELRLAGFTSYPALAIGDTVAHTFCVEFYRKDHGNTATEYEYLAGVEIGGATEFVAIPALPDLLEFMRQTIPLSISIDNWSVEHEKYIEGLSKEQ